MNEKEFKEKLNNIFNELAYIFQQINLSKEEDIELHTKALVSLSCFSHFLIEHSSFIKGLSKKYLSMVYTLLVIAKSENLSSAFELGSILESQKISR